MSKVYFEESGYLELIKDTLNYGVFVPDRTGVGCFATFDAKLVFDVGEHFPFSTSRVAGTRLAFEEFWFFLNGKTQTKELEEKGIFFWQGNTTREFLDKRGLKNTPEGDMGYAYGSQLRRYAHATIDTEFELQGYSRDQLKDTIETLSSDKYSRRIYNTMWNPNESRLMALTPCHHSHQFVVLPDEDGNDTLHLKLINRSLDLVFGTLFAVQQYALYLMSMAKMFGFKVGKLSLDMTHIHVYSNQVDYAKEICERELGKNGILTIKKDLNNMEDLLTMQWEDIEIVGLEVNKKPIITPRPPMAA